MRCRTRSEPIPPRLLRAYLLTRYRAVGFDVRIGRPVPEALFVRLGTRSAVLITAWNPRSRRMQEGWNLRMQQRLRQRLRRFGVVDAEGGLHRWREAMVVVAGDPRPIVRLAVCFRQRGVVVLRRGHKARLSTQP